MRTFNYFSGLLKHWQLLALSLPFVTSITLQSSVLTALTTVPILLVAYHRNFGKIPLKKMYIYFAIISFAFLLNTLIAPPHYLPFPEVLNIVVALVLLPILYLYLEEEEKFKLFEKMFFSLCFFIVLAISILGLLKFVLTLILNGNSILPENLHAAGRIGTKLRADYNLFAFSCLAGLIAAIYLFQKNYHAQKSTFLYLIGCFLISTNILFSGSRRGTVILGLFWAAMFSYAVLKKNKKLFILVASSFILFSIVITLSLTYNNGEAKASKHQHSLYIRRVSTVVKPKQLVASRPGLLEQAWRLWSSRSIMGKIFGDGFDYTEIHNINTAFSGHRWYPHSMFISAFLYGGVLGFLLLLIYLFFSIKQYLIHIRTLKYFFFITILVVCYATTGGNTFFTNVNLLLFSSLPFAKK